MEQRMDETCSRCKESNVEKLSESVGYWVIFHCGTCGFIWQSTEPPHITDSRLYDPRFVVDPAAISQWPTMPEIANKPTVAR